jgi:hypothetical protein
MPGAVLMIKRRDSQSADWEEISNVDATRSVEENVSQTHAFKNEPREKLMRIGHRDCRE